jgi:hypothetical protein
MRSSTRWFRRRSALAMAALTGVAVAMGIAFGVARVAVLTLGFDAGADDFLPVTFNEVIFKGQPPRN